MDVRSIESVPKILFADTVPVWQLITNEEIGKTIKDGELDLVIEFELVNGRTTDPHRHPTHEFYYILAGRGTMLVDDEERPVHQGDFVWVPPNALHQLRPLSADAPLRCFTFVIREKSSENGAVEGASA